jgi:hypothetical protein
MVTRTRLIVTLYIHCFVSCYQHRIFLMYLINIQKYTDRLVHIIVQSSFWAYNFMLLAFWPSFADVFRPTWEVYWVFSSRNVSSDQSDRDEITHFPMTGIFTVLWVQKMSLDYVSGKTKDLKTAVQQAPETLGILGMRQKISCIEVTRV